MLHASAVRLDAEVVAFTAASGVGKSTLAVQLAACGAEYLADDMVVVRLEREGAQVVLGPRLGQGVGRHLRARTGPWSRERGLRGGAWFARYAVACPTVTACHSDACALSLTAARGRLTITTLSGARRLVAVAEADFAAAARAAGRASGIAREGP